MNSVFKLQKIVVADSNPPLTQSKIKEPVPTSSPAIKASKKIAPEDNDLPSYEVEDSKQQENVAKELSINIEDDEGKDGSNENKTKPQVLRTATLPPVQRRNSSMMHVTNIVIDISEKTSRHCVLLDHLLHFIQQTIAVHTMTEGKLEYIGVEGMAYMTSDLIAKCSAICIVFVMLGFNASWSSCVGSITLKTFAIESACAVAVTYLIEIPFTLWEANQLGYDLVEVIRIFKIVKFDWQSYGILILCSASSLTIMMVVEAGLFAHNACFDKG
ncbi:hypothetical protein HDU76_001487 [Blyttiomyces sp. JEL0837]|nr:hypothetical protein HDU76_001487 [Blyttiomyces sp. JEL0837]